MITWRRLTSPARILLAGLVAALAATHFPLPAAWAAGDLRVSAGTVTGDLRAESLRSVLEALGAGRDFALELSEELGGYPISARLENLPLAEALGDLLRPFDYVMTFDAGGRPMALRISGTRQLWSPPTGRGEAGQEATLAEGDRDPLDVVGEDGMTPREREAGERTAALAYTPDQADWQTGVPVVDEEGRLIYEEGEIEPDPEDVVGEDGMTPRERQALEQVAEAAYLPPEAQPSYGVWDADGQLINEGVEILPNPDDVVGQDGMTPRERRHSDEAIAVMVEQALDDLKALEEAQQLN